MRTVYRRAKVRKFGAVIGGMAMVVATVGLGVTTAQPAFAASCRAASAVEMGNFANMSLTGSITGYKDIGPVRFTVTVTPDWVLGPGQQRPPDLNTSPDPSRPRFAGVVVANNPGPPRFETRGPTNHVVIETSEPVTDLALSVGFFGTTRQERMLNFSLLPTSVTGQGSLNSAGVVVPSNIDGTVALHWTTAVQRIEFDWTSLEDGGVSAVGTALAYSTGLCDMGDAPESYGSSYSMGTTPALALGAAYTNDTADLYSADASADVDDALTVPLRSVSGNADAAYTVTVPVRNTTTYPAALQGWIDFNRDGLFDSSEAASVTVPAGGASAVLSWPSSESRVAGQSFLRLRLHQTPGGSAGPTGVSAGGEVEDYPVTINAIPVITEPANGLVTNDNTPTVTGTGTPGERVEVRDADENVLCAVDVMPATGIWSCTTGVLADGDHSLIPVATATDGTQTTGVAVGIRIDTVPPTTPVITDPENGDEVATSTPSFTVTGEPASTVTVLDGLSRSLCSATVDAAGSATCQSTIALADGPQSVHAVATDAAGNTAAGAPVAFTVDTAPTPTPTPTTPTPTPTTPTPTPTTPTPTPTTPTPTPTKPTPTPTKPTPTHTPKPLAYRISPSAGPQGTVITFTGTGCMATNRGRSGTDGVFVFVIRSRSGFSSQVQAPFQSASNGTFHGRLRVPAKLKSGLYSTGVWCYSGAKAGWPKKPTYQQFRVTPVKIHQVYYDPPGRDTRSNASLNAEFVTLKNTTAAGVRLTGWTLRDRHGIVYRFGSFILGPGKSVTVHTGKARNTAVHRYWGRSRYVWDNTNDSATLRAGNGTLMHQCAWSRNLRYRYC